MAIQDSVPNSSHLTAKPRSFDRGARLGISLSGTNLERAADYNQRTVLQAIRVSGEASRSNLAVITGLTAPTIANIARRLLDAGLISEAGRRQGPRGQPASQLVINPTGGSPSELTSTEITSRSYRLIWPVRC